MTFEEYKEEILNGEKIEWYGTMVPRKLVTNIVIAITNSVLDSLNKDEAKLCDMRNGTKERISKQNYLDNELLNIRHLPYTNNGLISDCYMIKYKRIIEEAKKETNKTKPKTLKPMVDTSKVEKEEEKPKTTVKGRRGKNNNLIFGNK